MWIRKTHDTDDHICTNWWKDFYWLTDWLTLSEAQDYFHIREDMHVWKVCACVVFKCLHNADRFSLQLGQCSRCPSTTTTLVYTLQWSKNTRTHTHTHTHTARHTHDNLPHLICCITVRHKPLLLRGYYWKEEYHYHLTNRSKWIGMVQHTESFVALLFHIGF